MGYWYEVITDNWTYPLEILMRSRGMNTCARIAPSTIIQVAVNSMPLRSCVARSRNSIVYRYRRCMIYKVLTAFISQAVPLNLTTN